MLNDKFRKTITVPFSGQEFTIRKIRPAKFAQVMGILPIQTNKDIAAQLAQFGDDLKTKSEADPQLEETATRFLLEYGVVSPKIWFGDEDKCPDDQVCAADLGGDTEALLHQIITFSYEFHALKDLDKFFRVDGAGDTGLSGTTLQQETIGNISNGVQDGEPIV